MVDRRSPSLKATIHQRSLEHGPTCKNFLYILKAGLRAAASCGRPRPSARGHPMGTVFRHRPLKGSGADRPLSEALDCLIGRLQPTEIDMRYLISRWRRECLWLDHFAHVNRWYYYRFRAVAVASSVTVPALVGLNLLGRGGATLRWITFALSLVAALSIALLELFRFGEKWRLYRHYSQRLVAEGWQFAERTGAYKAANDSNDSTNAFNSFVDEVEAVLKNFETEYQTEAIILRDQNDHKASALGAHANQDT